MSGSAGNKVVAGVGAVLVLIVTVIAMQRFGAGPWDEPLVGPSEYDFGAIPLDTPVTRHIGLVSHADEVLFLRNVTRSCKCATVEVESTTVAPGATVDVAVTMTVDGPDEKQSRVTLIFETSEGELVRNVLVKARGAE